MTMGIYKIENLINHKKYIGQSVNIERRWEQHKTRSIDFYDKSFFSPFYTDLRSLGFQNFSFTIVEEINDKNKLNEREQYWMDYFDTLKSGYNIIPAPNEKLQKTKKRRIIIEDIADGTKKTFRSFNSLLYWLRTNHITNARSADLYFTRAIKNKTPIYHRWYIYYGKEDVNELHNEK